MKQENRRSAPVEAAASFARLTSPEMRGVLRYIQDAAYSALDDMAKTEDPDYWRRLKGRYSLAHEMLELVEAVTGERLTPQRGHSAVEM